MAELNVTKKTISKLFSEMQNRKFIIPYFQRPYKWEKELCETLWNDIEDFTINNEDDDYFLGTIVSYLNQDTKNLEIIDGQQRITSILLLLRAFYRKLEDMNQSDEDVIGLMNQIAPCIWDINPISQKVTDKTKKRIESFVITDDDKETFHKILETGNTDDSLDDNYTINYGFFKEKCDEYAQNNPLGWKNLCVTILSKCIILPIECNSPDTALKIFTTLNDRGLPLADSDVFKAEIYKNIDSEEERKQFTETWNDLTQLCNQAGISLDDIFRYYMHIIRARNSYNSKEVGLRRFFSAEKYKHLRIPELIDELVLIATFWVYVNKRKNPSTDDGYKISNETRKYLHCLSWYPNEYWKFPVSVFFLRNYKMDNFDNELCCLLKKLIAFLFLKFIFNPSINAIRDDIYNIYINIHNGNNVKLSLQFDNEDFIRRISSFSSSRISRAIILLNAYLNDNQNDLISETFDIEHIFPKKWQDTNYNGWNIKDAKLFLERFGNKIVLEKKLNIQAGNGYFGEKKKRYSSSKIASIIELANLPKNDWVKTDILNRENKMIEDIVLFINKNLS
ncbi:MAG: DUF262 domain-containing HNH endonuclease family protein [Bacteroidetes bacterium]|nr:DUF262 domain-containing HNH endonuclease family protein [Bacteroidota bacterium]